MKSKYKGRKLLVFWIIHLTLSIIYVLHIFFAADQLSNVGQMIIIMMVGNGATFIGGNVVAAWQKSKYYRSELDDTKRENNAQ